MGRFARAMDHARSDLAAGRYDEMVSRWVAAARRQARLPGLWMTDPSVREWRSRAESLRGLRSGPCFVAGNGPSLNELPLDRLAGHAVFAVNGFHLILDRVAWLPTAYLIVDELAWKQNANQVLALAQRGCDVFVPLRFRTQGLLARGPHVNVLGTQWVDARDPAHLPDLPRGGSLARRGLLHAYTVVASAIHLAAYMGYDPIYLIGVDMTLPEPGADEIGGDGIVRVAEAGSPSGTHFSDGYRTPGSRHYAPPRSYHLASLRAAGVLAGDLGSTVRNATRGGRLELFERVAFETVA